MDAFPPEMIVLLLRSNILIWGKRIA